MSRPGFWIAEGLREAREQLAVDLVQTTCVGSGWVQEERADKYLKSEVTKTEGWGSGRGPSKTDLLPQSDLKGKDLGSEM